MFLHLDLTSQPRLADAGSTTQVQYQQTTKANIMNTVIGQHSNLSYGKGYKRRSTFARRVRVLLRLALRNLLREEQGPKDSLGRPKTNPLRWMG